jgi:hypothetical protein
MNFAASQEGGVANVAVGHLTGAGAIEDVTLGFVPRHIRVVNETDQLIFEKYAGQVAANVMKIAANGTVTTDTGSLITVKGSAKTDTFKGFELAAALAVNAKVLHWIAFG